MTKAGVIEASEFPWSSPVVLARKKDGSWRFCVDYRKLNAITTRDAFPSPRLDDTLDVLGATRSSRRWTWRQGTGKCPSMTKIERKQPLSPTAASTSPTVPFRRD
jgi:hypothetical protein